jgi:glycosyltransferase involved in cell wall biosynthesis
MISRQTFKDFDVVVADHSTDDKIMSLCKMWDNIFDIRYYRNKENRGSAAANTNFAIKMACGEWIKVLCQDDYLFDKNSLQIIADNLDDSVNWLFTDYVHSYNRMEYFKQHHPSMNYYIAINNSLGTPSAMTLKNEIELPEFDNNLTYCYDEDFYFQMYKMYGDPKIIDEVTMVNFLWDGSITSKITQDLINKENNYIINKHGIKF